MDDVKPWIPNWLSGDDRYSMIAAMLREGRLVDIPEYMANRFEAHEIIDRGYMINRLEAVGTGIRILGSGCYSIVVTIPGVSGAVKLTYNRSDKWVEYARYAMAHHHENPMLLKVFELYEVGGWCVARMELLEDACIARSVGMYDVVKAVRSPVFGLMNPTRKRKREKIDLYLRKWFDLDWIGGYSREYLADIVIWLAGKGSKVCIDCHGKNWMQRNMQLVLTDPIT